MLEVTHLGPIGDGGRCFEFQNSGWPPLTGRGDLGQLAGKIIRVIGNGSSTNYTYIALLKNQIMRSCIFEIIPTNALIMKCIYCGSA